MAKLLDLSTNEFVEVPDVQVQEAIFSGRYGFPKGSSVLLRGPEGEQEFPAEEALSLIAEQDFQLISPERQEFEKQKALRESTPEQLKTIAEGVTKGATVGLSGLIPEALKGIAPEQVEEYKRAALEREFFNPGLHSASDIFGSVAPILLSGGALGATRAGGMLRYLPSAVVDDIAIKAGKIITDKVGKKGLAGIMKTASKLGVEGAIDGGAFAAGDHVYNTLMRDQELTAEGILNSMGVGAAFGGATAGMIGAGGKGFLKAYKATREAVAERMKRFAGISDNERVFESITYDILKPTRNKDHFNTRGVLLKGRPDSELVQYKDRNRTVEINPDKIEGKILDLDNPELVNDFGLELGIVDLSSKIQKVRQKDDLADYLTNIAIGDDVHITHELLTLIESRGKVFSDKINKIEDMKDKVKRMTVDQGLPYPKKELSRLNSMEAKVLKDMEKANLISARQLQGALGSTSYRKTKNKINEILEDYDAIKMDGSFVVKKPQILANALEAAFRKRMPKKGKASVAQGDISILRAIGAQKPQFRRLTDKQIKEMAKFTRKHFNDEFKGVSAVLTNLDDFMERVAQTQENAIFKMDDSVSKLENYMIENGIKSNLTGEDIGNYILRKYTDQLTDPELGRVVPGAEQSLAKAKEFAKSFMRVRAQEVAPGVYKQLPFSPLEFRELRKKLDDNVTNWTGDAPIGQMLNRDARFRMEEKLVKLMETEKGAEKLVKEYKNAKKDYEMAMRVNDLTENAWNKEAANNGLSLTGYISGGAAGAIGAVIDPTFTLPAALLGAGGRKLVQSYGDNAKAWVLSKMYESNISLLQSVESAAAKFVKASLRPAAIGVAKVGTPKVAPMTYEAYQEKYDQVMHSYENLLDEFSQKEELISQMAPDIATALFAKIYAAEKFLESKAPKVFLTPFSKIQPDYRQIAKFNRYLRAVESPANILQEFEEGQVSNESIEVLEKLYPAVYQRVYMEIIDAMAKEGNTSYKQRQELNRIFGIQTNLYNQPAALRTLQSLHAPKVEPQQKKSDTKIRKAKDTVSPARETQTQRLQRR